MVKRLFAVGTGVAMLGATAMGALAADLGSYPGMFVEDGKFNGFLVVGENAAAVDNLAMTDIGTSMKYNAPSSTSVTTVEGDAWRVESGSDVLEFTESFGPAASGVVDFLDDDDLAALADGTLKSSQGTFKYEQFIHFDKSVVNTTYAEDDDDITALFLMVPDNTLFARYEMNFLEAAESDIDSSDSYKLDDYDGKQLTFLGKTYDIVKAVTGGANNEQVTLTLMSGSAVDSILEGESQTYTVGSNDYEVELTYTDDSSRAKFVINGQGTPLMDESDTETLDDGTVFGLSEVLYQNYAGGVHRATFFIGADKIVLQDDNISVGSSTDELQVNDETIDGADVIISGTMLDWATSATEDGELEIDTITINMTSQDTYYIAAGETLLDQAELEEKDLLFSQNWDIRFDGLDSSIETDMISVKDKSGEKEYELTFTNVGGDVIKVPLAYANGTASVRLGDQNDMLVLNNSRIKDDQYFILNDDSDEDSVTHVVQYKGSDDSAKSNPQAKFKILATGETLSRPVTHGTGVNGATGTLKLSGTTYTFTNVSSSIGSGHTMGVAANTTTSDDWDITVTGGSNTFSSIRGSSGGNIQERNLLITGGGGQILIYTTHNVSVPYVYFNVSLIDGDMHDDVLGSDPSTTNAYLVFDANISASSSELDFAAVGGVSLVSPDDEDDNNYGYAVHGAYLKRVSPSGGGTTADTIEIEWPQKERTVAAYVTSGAVTATTASGGDLVPVEVVDATKLDSEIASATAQNLIVVGGPCVNTVAAELLGSGDDCAEGFTPGKARVKFFEHANGNMAMLVAGYSGADTRLAGQFIAHRPGDLSGAEVEIEGTTYSDATVGAPTPVVAAPAETTE